MWVRPHVNRVELWHSTKLIGWWYLEMSCRTFVKYICFWLCNIDWCFPTNRYLRSQCWILLSPMLLENSQDWEILPAFCVLENGTHTHTHMQPFPNDLDKNQGTFLSLHMTRLETDTPNSHSLPLKWKSELLCSRWRRFEQDLILVWTLVSLLSFRQDSEFWPILSQSQHTAPL